MKRGTEAQERDTLTQVFDLKGVNGVVVANWRSHEDSNPEPAD